MLILRESATVLAFPPVNQKFLVPAFRPVNDPQSEQRSGGFICGRKQTNLISTSFAASLPSLIT